VQGQKQPRFSWKREVALGLGFYAIYLLIRSLALRGDGRDRAMANAEKVVAVERQLGVHLEPRIQQAVLPHRRLCQTLNVAYATLNVGLTVGWLALLFRRRHPAYHELRRAALLAGLGAQPVFLWFPVAPPRKLDHLVDTIADIGGVDLDSGPIEKLYNPLAAFPSIHVTIAVVTADGMRRTSRSAATRALAPAYPPLVAAVVLSTANHYIVDAVAGYGLGRLALRAARLFGRS
jgi:hypothetical protein